MGVKEMQFLAVIMSSLTTGRRDPESTRGTVTVRTHSDPNQ